tara:strand:- start:343 stop:501 length:159 start_codon:yes stop_codon:yes gene_type:complete
MQEQVCNCFDSKLLIESLGSFISKNSGQWRQISKHKPIMTDVLKKDSLGSLA